MDYQKIKKVHVVYKTHLDIGFTDMGRNVLDRYVKEYIPHSVRLAEEMNGGKEKRFIWTVGSYLIDYYLKLTRSFWTWIYSNMAWSWAAGWIHVTKDTPLRRK